MPHYGLYAVSSRYNLFYPEKDCHLIYKFIKTYLFNDVTLMNMDLPEFRTWIFFYLISSVALLWAAFLSAQGFMLWVSVLLVLLVIGTNCIFVLAEIRKYAKKREIMKRLSEIDPATSRDAASSAIGQK